MPLHIIQQKCAELQRLASCELRQATMVGPGITAGWGCSIAASVVNLHLDRIRYTVQDMIPECRRHCMVITGGLFGR